MVCSASAVWTISPFFGALRLSSEKRSRDPSRQVIVICHVAIRAMGKRPKQPLRSHIISPLLDATALAEGD
jgi:hypothetical protein